MAVEIRTPRVEIEFCTGCKWHLRAGWMAQELLLTFGNSIGELALIPGKSATFIVRVNGDVVFNRADHKRFPEMKEVKQLVRTIIAPEMGLGHSDTPVKSAEGEKKKEEEQKAPSEAVQKQQRQQAAAVDITNDVDDEDSTAHNNFDCKTCA
ncbi:hypothetical protein BGZ76_000731 [Entomortierella beljakovae]|nr:hypothetical protein BGZ76_000731 [Entomortierella beljakovae]